MKTAFITGIGGQDGYFLSRLLLNKGYKVYGLVRAADKTRIRIGIRAVVRVAIRAFLRFVGGVKRVGGRVRADKTFAATHKIKQRLFAGGRHWRLLVGALAAQIAGGVEKHRVKLREIFRAELRAVLGESKFPAVLRAELKQNFFRKAGLAIFPRNDRVLKAAGFREKQDFLGCRRGGDRKDEEAKNDGDEQGTELKCFHEF